MDLALWNFGIQEAASTIRSPSDELLAIFPGMPRVENGYMFVNEAPGLGIDVNEEEAAKYPLQEVQLNNWTQLRRPDGTPVRP
jgi:mannonate dehydratase